MNPPHHLPFDDTNHFKNKSNNRTKTEDIIINFLESHISAVQIIIFSSHK